MRIVINLLQEMNYFLMKEIIENYIHVHQVFIVKKENYVPENMLQILKLMKFIYQIIKKNYWKKI